MPLPAGITTCTVTFGRALGGVLGTQGTITGTVETDRTLVWAATGETLYDIAEDVQLYEAGNWLTFAAPHVDQPGFRDQSGATITGFSMIFRGTVKFPGQPEIRVVKAFQVFTGQSAADLDLLPDGPVTAPVTAPAPVVTSVAGLTGAVSRPQLEAALGLTALAARITALEAGAPPA